MWKMYPVGHLHSLKSHKSVFKARGAGKAILPQISFVSILVNCENILFLLYSLAYVCCKEGRGGGGAYVVVDVIEELCVK